MAERSISKAEAYKLAMVPLRAIADAANLIALCPSIPTSRQEAIEHALSYETLRQRSLVLDKTGPFPILHITNIPRLWIRRSGNARYIVLLSDDAVLQCVSCDITLVSIGGSVTLSDYELGMSDYRSFKSGSYLADTVENKLDP